MTEKDTSPASLSWMFAGVGMTLRASQMMLDTAVKMQRAGRPAGLLLGATPFAVAGVVLRGFGERTAPAAQAVEAEGELLVKAAAVEPEVELAEIVVPEVESVPVEPVSGEPVSGEAVSVEKPAVVVPEVELAVVEGPEVAEPVQEVLAFEAALVEPEVSEPARTALAEAPAGPTDDLRLIKGIGPKLAAQLNGLGYYYFEQIARWSGEELDWVDAHLVGFSGRALRDDWIGQARELMEGRSASQELL